MSQQPIGVGGPTVSRKSGDNGFWSNVSSGLGEGIGTIGKELLPIWAARKMELQRIDQLEDTTFDGRFAPPRIDDQRRSTGDSANQSADDRANNDLTGTILIGSAVIAVILFAFAVGRK